jgi:primosomal protein N' (replication factor Y)
MRSQKRCLILRCMYYYEVLVGDSHFHGDDVLTYSYASKLPVGAVVRVSLRNRPALAVVTARVPEPSFKTKPLSAVAPTCVVPPQTLALIEWLKDYYPAPIGVIVRHFLPPSTAFPKKAKDNSSDTSHANAPSKSPTLPPLTTEQTAALGRIEPTGFHLLHGVTGSGKSRVYLELAQKAYETGKSSIILTPEIGLTTQLAQDFKAYFGPAVVIVHSRLTETQRRDLWYELLESTSPRVVIGARSALFSPLQQVGLVIIDECHDQAYKSDSAPRYRTDRVAAKLASLHGCPLVLGSATPTIEDTFLAAAKKRPILHLRERAIKNAVDHASTTKVIDLRDRSAFTRSSSLSDELLAAVALALENREQSLLFLNRRGTANAILCSHCGWQALCQHCDLPLTYHGDSHTVRCHVCGRLHPLPTACPECSETDIILKNIGTKAVVMEVERLFPHARVRRFDTDVAKADQLENQLPRLTKGEADILVGTQMITKGLDLPRLSVVGVLSADGSMLIPDYSAAERTFQLISQVVGRVGRGHRPGATFVQTYDPSNPVLSAAVTQNYEAFYDRERAEREQYHFPPYVFLLKLTCLRATSASAEKTATKLSEQLQNQHPRLKVEGPSPAFHPRESGKYKWQLIVKSPSRTALVDIIRALPSGWTHDLDPVNLL